MDCSRETFAEWSFERDRSVGLFRRTMTWDRLPQEDRDMLLAEADEYMKQPQDQWPDDILERLKEK